MIQGVPLRRSVIKNNELVSPPSIHCGRKANYWQSANLELVSFRLFVLQYPKYNTGFLS